MQFRVIDHRGNIVGTASADAPPSNIAAWLLETGVPGDPAIVDGSSVVSYAELRRRVLLAAGVVRAHASATGERAVVLIVGENTSDQVVAYLGTLYAGAIAAPVAARPSHLRAIVDDTGATFAFANSSALAAVRDVLPTACSTDASSTASEVAPLAAPEAVPADAPALLFHTSGSTGRPQAVAVSTRNLCWSTEAILASVPIDRADRGALVLPTYYCYGASVLHTHLRRGARLVLADAADPVRLVAELGAAGVTGLAGVPTVFSALLSRRALIGHPLASLRYIMVSGGALGERRISELETALPGVALYVRYGVTELTAAASILPPEHLRDKPGSIGRGLLGAPLRVEDQAMARP